MERVLVSACLLGSPVRYDGTHKRSASDVLQQWLIEGRVIAVCPEHAGGLPTPRQPAEIVGRASGASVLSGMAQVIDRAAMDQTEAFVAGARHALGLVRAHGIRVAVLKEGSPSCGANLVHDGSFSGMQVPGQGVTAALLASAGIRVFSEAQFEEADEALRWFESHGASAC